MTKRKENDWTAAYGVARDELRGRFAQDRATSARLALASLKRELALSAPKNVPGARPVYALDNVVVDLGLSVAQRAAARKAVSGVVTDTRSMFGIGKKLLDLGLDKYQTAEILRRAQELKANMAVRKGGDASLTKAPNGFTPIPTGKKGGYRKLKGGGGYDYWYPGGGVVGKPHEDDHPSVHEDHEKATPTPEVSAAVKKVRAKAEAAGLKLDGFQPTAKTTMADVAKLDAHVDHGANVAANNAKLADTLPSYREEDDDDDETDNEDEDEPTPTESADAGDGTEDADSEADDTPGDSEDAVGGDDNDPDEDDNDPDDDDEVDDDDGDWEDVPEDDDDGEDADEDDGDWEDVDEGDEGDWEDVGEPVGQDADGNPVYSADDYFADEEEPHPTGEFHPADAEFGPDGLPADNTPPSDAAEMAHLKVKVAQLTAALDQVNQQVEEQHRQLYNYTQQYGRHVANNPTESGLASLFSMVTAFLNLAVPTAVGALMGGPAGAVMGAMWGAHQNKRRSYRVRKGGVYYDPHTDRLVVATDNLVKADTYKVPEGARGNARKVLAWKKEHGSDVKGMTPVGWARARQLASQTHVGMDTVKRMSSFNRHRKNAAVDPKHSSEPWKDRGYVAWLGWGGSTGVDWARGITGALTKSQRPSGSGWATIPGGKKNGYRKRKGSGYEYWYPDGKMAGVHVAHHGEMLNAARKRNATYAAKLESVGPDSPRSGIYEKISASSKADIAVHEAALSAAKEAAARPTPDPGGDRMVSAQAHAGRKTLGVDEGTVWSTVADALDGQVYQPRGGDRTWTEQKAHDRVSETGLLASAFVHIKTVTGGRKRLRVEFKPSKGGFHGHLESAQIAQWDPRTDKLDHNNLASVPRKIVIFVPNDAPGNVEAYKAEARKVLAHEMAHAIDDLTAGHKKRDQKKYGDHGEGYYNDPAEVVAYRHNMYRDLNTPEVAAAVEDHLTMWESTKEEAAELRDWKQSQGEDALGVHAGRPEVSGQMVTQFLDQHSPAWEQVGKHLNASNRRKFMQTAAAVLSAHADGTSEPMAKAGPVYTGPRGGKWADPQHTIPYDDDPAKAADRRRKEKRTARKEKRKPADWATSGGDPKVKTLNVSGEDRQYRMAADGFEVEGLREWTTPDGEKKSKWSQVKNYTTATAVREAFDPKKKAEGERRRELRDADTKRVAAAEAEAAKAPKNEDDYRMAHQPSKLVPAHDMGSGKDVPKDILEHPEWYTGFPDQLREFWPKLKAAQGNPDATITIHRAMPKDRTGQPFQTGNWVTLSHAYAKDHAEGEDGWHVVSQNVPLKDLHWAGDDLAEWGYWGSGADAATKSRRPPPPTSTLAKARAVREVQRASRARRPKNEHGHRDGLTPGDRLALRKAHTTPDNPDHVIVRAGGKFAWGDTDYSNARRLLAAVTGNPGHHLTARRYFRLGN